MLHTGSICFYIQGTKTRFLDTLSLHMCISGQTTLQRALWHVNQKGAEEGAAPGLRKQQKKKSFGTPVSLEVWQLTVSDSL